MAVNTAKVGGRRKLDFGSYQEMLADADRVGSGPVKVSVTGRRVRSSNIWRSSTTDRSMASTARPRADPGAGKAHEEQASERPDAGGIKLPKATAIISSTPVKPTSRRAWLPCTQPWPGWSRSRTSPRPVFGPVTREEWDRIHLKHASLHLSFLIPQA